MTGGAGVGKSVVIRALYQTLYRILNLKEWENSDDKIYPTKKETHTVAFSNFLENNNKFSYFIYTDLECVDRAVHPMNFTNLDSIHFFKL